MNGSEGLTQSADDAFTMVSFGQSPMRTRGQIVVCSIPRFMAVELSATGSDALPLLLIKSRKVFSASIENVVRFIAAVTFIISEMMLFEVFISMPSLHCTCLAFPLL